MNILIEATVNLWLISFLDKSWQFSFVIEITLKVSPDTGVQSVQIRALLSAQIRPACIWV